MGNKSIHNNKFLFDANLFIHFRDYRKPKYISRTVQEFKNVFHTLAIALGDKLITLDSVVDEVKDRTVKDVFNEKYFEIKKARDIPDEIKEKVRDNTEMKLTTRGGTADYDLICFMHMNPDYTLVTNDNALCHELRKISPEANYLPNWAFLFLAAMRTGKEKHQKYAAKELRIDAKLQTSKTVVDWPVIGLKGFHDFMKLDNNEDDSSNIEKELQDRNLMFYNRIRGLEKKIENKRKEKREVPYVKPGIVSRFSNWVFIKAKSFRFAKKNEEKSALKLNNTQIENRIKEILSDLKLLEKEGHCLYMGKANHIDFIKSGKITIVSGETNSNIPITLELKNTELIMLKSVLIGHIVSEFDVTHEQARNVIQKLLNQHILFNKKLVVSNSKKKLLFVGLGKLD